MLGFPLNFLNEYHGAPLVSMWSGVESMNEFQYIIIMHFKGSFQIEFVPLHNRFHLEIVLLKITFFSSALGWPLKRF